MHPFALDVPVDLEELRERLRKMTDEQLLRFGRAAQSMCSPSLGSVTPPGAEARAELNELPLAAEVWREGSGRMFLYMLISRRSAVQSSRRNQFPIQP
jgi:hypothetical protein